MTSLTQYDKHLLFYTKRPETVFVKGEGTYLYDQQGIKYLDFLAGWAVNSLGHCPKVVVDTLTQQAGTLINSSPAFYNEPMLEFAALLNDNTVFSKAFFASSGAEANESAIKLARKHGQKFKQGASDVITLARAFHGRTLATMSATGKPQWKDLFEPKPLGFKQAKFNDIESIKSTITPNTCAIMLEPIQGEGGVYPADHRFISELKTICDQEDILLIFDEVQTGFGRTGKLFGYEHFDVVPDIMTLGKGIGSGFPMSAMLTHDKLDIFDPGDQGGTYTGQPLAMAVGNAVLTEIIDKNLSENSEKMGKLLREGLEERKDSLGIAEIRGIGLLIGIDFQHDNAAEFAQKCFDNKLILAMAGPKTVRLVPPLIISEEHIQDFFRIIDSL